MSFSPSNDAFHDALSILIDNLSHDERAHFIFTNNHHSTFRPLFDIAHQLHDFDQFYVRLGAQISVARNDLREAQDSLRRLSGRFDVLNDEYEQGWGHITMLRRLASQGLQALDYIHEFEHMPVAPDFLIPDSIRPPSPIPSSPNHDPIPIPAPHVLPMVATSLDDLNIQLEELVQNIRFGLLEGPAQTRDRLNPPTLQYPPSPIPRPLGPASRSPSWDPNHFESDNSSQNAIVVPGSPTFPASPVITPPFPIHDNSPSPSTSGPHHGTVPQAQDPSRFINIQEIAPLIRAARRAGLQPPIHPRSSILDYARSPSNSSAPSQPASSSSSNGSQRTQDPRRPTSSLTVGSSNGSTSSKSTRSRRRRHNKRKVLNKDHYYDNHHPNYKYDRDFDDYGDSAMSNMTGEGRNDYGGSD